MATNNVSATTVFELQIGASDSNGGGFDPSSAGMLTDLAATVANTSAPVVTSASYNFVAGDVGNWLFIQSGTNWTAGWYQIASVAANAATLTAGIGTALSSKYVANTVAGCATVASPTGGVGTIDYSQNVAANITTGAVLSTSGVSTTLTATGSPFKPVHVGNSIYISAGTNFTVGYYTIVTYTDANNVVLNVAPTTGVGASGVGAIGGALLTIGRLGYAAVAGNQYWIKYNATAFISTNSTNNVSLGRWTPAAGTSLNLPSRIRGYDALRGDEPTLARRPVLQWGVNAADLILININQFNIVENIIFDANGDSFTGTRCIANTGNAPIVVRRCKFMDGSSANGLVTFGQTTSAYHLIIDCEVTGATATVTTGAVAISSASAPVFFIGCTIHDNLSHGVYLNNASVFAHFINCIFATNKSTTTKDHIFFNLLAKIFCLNCTFYNSGSHAIDAQSTVSQIDLINCYFDTAGGYGLNVGAANGMIRITNSAFFASSLTSGAYTVANVSPLNVIGEITITATAFNNAAGNDFSISRVTAAGAALRGTGVPTSFPGLSTPNYLEVGGAQNQDLGPVFQHME